MNCRVQRKETPIHKLGNWTNILTNEGVIPETSRTNWIEHFLMNFLYIQTEQKDVRKCRQALVAQAEKSSSSSNGNNAKGNVD